MPSTKMRRECDICRKMYLPKGGYSYYCDACLKKKKIEWRKRLVERWRRNNARLKL
jgi:hypothetical protein